MLAKHETESSITGELSIAINIPSFSSSGQGEVNLTKSELIMMEQTCLTMYGDYSLCDGSLPIDFDSACDFIKDILS